MLFRTNKGELIEVKKYDFPNDKLYYKKLMEIIKNEKGDQLISPDTIIRKDEPKRIIEPEEKDSMLNKIEKPDTIIFSNQK